MQNKSERQITPKTDTLSSPKTVLEKNMKGFFSSEEDFSSNPYYKNCVKLICSTNRPQKITRRNLINLKSLNPKMPKQTNKPDDNIDPFVTLLP